MIEQLSEQVWEMGEELSMLEAERKGDMTIYVAEAPAVPGAIAYGATQYQAAFRLEILLSLCDWSFHLRETGSSLVQENVE